MKENDEGIPFHTLLTTGMHRSDRISRRKMKGGSVHPVCGRHSAGSMRAACRG
jgi:hypothetical protein